MTVDEKMSQQAADHSLILNRASLAERGENYPKRPVSMKRSCKGTP